MMFQYSLVSSCDSQIQPEQALINETQITCVDVQSLYKVREFAPPGPNCWAHCAVFYCLLEARRFMI